MDYLQLVQKLVHIGKEMPSTTEVKIGIELRLDGDDAEISHFFITDIEAEHDEIIIHVDD